MTKEKIQVEFFRNMPYRHMEEEALKSCKMWRALLDTMAEDIINNPDNDEEEVLRAHAQYWLSGGIMYDAISDGFSDVCDMADFPPDWVREKFMSMRKEQQDES